MATEMKAVETSVQPKEKRTFRSAEERIAEIDKKIAFHSKAIAQLEERKQKINSPRQRRKMTYAKLFSEIKASGMTPEQIAEIINR